MAKRPVIVIHGGSCWAAYEDYIKDLKGSKFEPDFSPRIGWQNNLQKSVGADFKVLLPEMPNWRNAKYQEWKIWFEKALSACRASPILVGHSLGAIFLAKYFSETVRACKIRGLCLVSTPFKTFTANPDFGDFALKGPPKRLGQFGKTIFFYQSEDDPIVSPDNLTHYHAVAPDAVLRIFKKRKHFARNTFPELADDIRSIK